MCPIFLPGYCCCLWRHFLFPNHIFKNAMRVYQWLRFKIFFFVISLNIFALSINGAQECLKSLSHPLQSSSPWLVWRIALQQGWSEDWEEEKQKRSWDCHGSAETGLFLVGLRSLARIWNFTFTLGSVRLCCSITIREAYKSRTTELLQSPEVMISLI